MAPGDIYQHDRFYLDPEDGQFKRKYVLILAAPRDRDLIARLLTSRVHGRPENPPCHHGAPYAGYYLGVLGAPLGAKTWVDLRGLDDLDVDEFGRAVRKGIAARVLVLSREMLIAVLDCAARADDTTRQQESLMRDTIASMR